MGRGDTQSRYRPRQQRFPACPLPRVTLPTKECVKPSVPLTLPVCFQSVLFQPLAPAVEPHHTYLCGLYLHIPNLQRPSQTFSEGSYLRVTSMSSFSCCYICILGCRQFAVRGTYLMPPEWKKFKNRAWRSTWHLTVLWWGRGCPVMRQRGHTTFMLKQGLLHPKLIYVAKDSSQNLIPPVLASWDYGFSGAQIKGFCKVSE